MVIPAGYVQLTYEFLRLGDSEPMVVSWAFEWDGSTPYQDIVNDAFDAWVASEMRDITATVITLSKVVGRFGTVGDGDLVIESTVTPTAGSNSRGPQPPNCALLYRKLSALGGRKNRGRMYYPCVLEDSTLANGALGTDDFNDSQSAYTDWGTLTIGVTGLDAFVLLHSDPDDDPTPLTAGVLQSKIATQRRRLRP